MFPFNTVANLHQMSDVDVTMGESATANTTPTKGPKKSRRQRKGDLRASLKIEEAQHEAALAKVIHEAGELRRPSRCLGG